MALCCDGGGAGMRRYRVEVHQLRVLTSWNCSHRKRCHDIYGHSITNGCLAAVFGYVPLVEEVVVREQAERNADWSSLGRSGCRGLARARSSTRCCSFGTKVVVYTTTFVITSRTPPSSEVLMILYKMYRAKFARSWSSRSSGG